VTSSKKELIGTNKQRLILKMLLLYSWVEREISDWSKLRFPDEWSTAQGDDEFHA
jgi:hypothetical protein